MPDFKPCACLCEACAAFGHNPEEQHCYAPVLTMTDLQTFTDEFMRLCEGKSLRVLASSVWKLANDQYRKGYNRGKDDPYYEQDEE